jgi:hypothetical protein
MPLFANNIIVIGNNLPEKTAQSFQTIRDAALDHFVRTKTKEQDVINTIKTSKYLEDLTNKGD